MTPMVGLLDTNFMRTLTEISYTGNKITLSRLQKYRRGKFFEQVQVVDDKKRVIDLKVSDLSGSQLKLWYHVTFKYDDKGRVVEQYTDPFKLGSTSLSVSDQTKSS